MLGRQGDDQSASAQVSNTEYVLFTLEQNVENQGGAPQAPQADGNGAILGEGAVHGQGGAPQADGNGAILGEGAVGGQGGAPQADGNGVILGEGAVRGQGGAPQADGNGAILGEGALRGDGVISGEGAVRGRGRDSGGSPPREAVVHPRIMPIGLDPEPQQPSAQPAQPMVINLVDGPEGDVGAHAGGSDWYEDLATARMVDDMLPTVLTIDDSPSAAYREIDSHIGGYTPKQLRCAKPYIPVLGTIHTFQYLAPYIPVLSAQQSIRFSTWHHTSQSLASYILVLSTIFSIVGTIHYTTWRQTL